MIKELTIKTTITDIVECYDKNNNSFYKVWIDWESGQSRIFYAFSNDFNLKKETWQTLTYSPEKFTNQRVTIAYQEKENKDGNGTFCQIKEIVI